MIKRFLASLLLAVSFLLSGCMTMPPMIQGATNGAMTGGALGCLAGLAIGDNRQSTKRGCIAGAVAGGAYGAWQSMPQQVQYQQPAYPQQQQQQQCAPGQTPGANGCQVTNPPLYCSYLQGIGQNHPNCAQYGGQQTQQPGGTGQPGQPQCPNGSYWNGTGCWQPGGSATGVQQQQQGYGLVCGPAMYTMTCVSLPAGNGCRRCS